VPNKTRLHPLFEEEIAKPSKRPCLSAALFFLDHSPGDKVQQHNLNKKI